MGLGRQDFSGKRLSPQEADAVITDLKSYLMGIADKWIIKGRFHSDMANGTLPMEAIKVFWQFHHDLQDFLKKEEKKLRAVK